MRLTSERADQYLASAFALARLQVLHPERWELVTQALAASYAESPALAAPTLAIDVALLAAGEKLEPLTLAASPLVRDAVRAWEDHVLARLVSDSRWGQVMDAVLAAPKELKGVAIGLLVSQVLKRLEVTDGVPVSQAVVRKLVGKTPEQVVEEGRASLRERSDVSAMVLRGLEATAHAARKSRDLLTDAEVFVLENVAALKGLGPRVALGQLAEISRDVEDTLPARLKSHHSEGDKATQLEEESAFPVGGFSSISTQGSIENLVTSELIYMDDAGAERPDLFDIRFVEGELLYYARDESVAVRRRRTLLLVLDASLDGCRVLDEGARAQRLVWCFASVVAMVRKLSSWLEAEALQFEVVSTRDGNSSVLAEDLAVLGLLLREWKERGQLDLTEVGTLDEAWKYAREKHKGRIQTVVFHGGTVSLEQLDAQVKVDQPVPSLQWASEPAQSAPWAAITRELLERLLGAKRSGLSEGRAA